MAIRYDELYTINIGHVRDNVLPVYEIDVSKLAEKWPDAAIQLIVTRPTEDGGYLADTVVNDGIMKWTIHRGDVFKDGQGHGQIVVSRNGDEFWHSHTFTTKIEKSLANDGFDPSVPTDLLDRVVAASGEVIRISAEVTAQVEEINRLYEATEGNANRSEESADRAEAALNELKECIASGDFKGEDGYTPVKGKDYFDGKDGYTPVKGVDYFDGEKGDPFTYEDFTPEQLEALKGKDGRTPVKGVDYFDGRDGSDASVTAANIESALGFAPANSADVTKL